VLYYVQKAELEFGKGGNYMAFNYAKLLGRIRECGFTQNSLAKKIGINKGTLSAKLNNQFAFTVTEMNAIRKALNIPKGEIGIYFFDEEVQKTE
jgi:transcriptional regulator with XRE-family HTH domain